MHTPEQRSAYIISQVACAMIEAMGMKAQNERRNWVRESPEYIFDDFENLINKYGISHNAVIGYLRDV